MKRGVVILLLLSCLASAGGCCCAREFGWYSRTRAWQNPCAGGACSTGNCMSGNCGGACGEYGGACQDWNSWGPHCGFLGRLGFRRGCMGCGGRYWGDWFAGRPCCWDPCDWCGNWVGPHGYSPRTRPITDAYFQGEDLIDGGMMGEEYEVQDGHDAEPTQVTPPPAPGPMKNTSLETRGVQRTSAQQPRNAYHIQAAQRPTNFRRG